MSELFAVRVAAVSPTSAKLEVRSVHPDSGPPAPTSTFALMLVFDPIMSSGYSEMRSYSHLESSPLAAEMDRDNYLDEQWIRQNANAFFSRVTVDKAILEVWPTHPAWIEHLRKGMAWETAAYDQGPGDPAPPRAPSADDAGEHSSDPNAGFTIGKPKSFPHDAEIDEALIPLHGPNMYVQDPVLIGDEMKAITTMAGQPILIIPQRGPKEIGVVLGPKEDWFCLYHEKGGGYGYHSVTLSEMKSIGRAWLKSSAASNGESNGDASTVSARSKSKPGAKSKSKSKTAAKSRLKGGKSKSATKSKKGGKSKASGKSKSKPTSKSKSSKSRASGKSKSK